MSFVPVLAVIIFSVSYFFIATENKFHTNKSAIALAAGGFLWLLVVFSGLDKGIIKTDLAEAGANIFSIIAFLLSAMTLVEILIHYRFFDWIGIKLQKMHMTDRKQFLIMGFLTFFLSTIIDNTTLTIIMVQVARGFFRGKNLLLAAGGIAILSNAGGAWSPTGDVNTLMIWLAGKVSTIGMLTKGFLPALSFAIVVAGIIAWKIKNEKRNVRKLKSITFSKGDDIIIVLCLLAFMSPLFIGSMGLEPYMGRLMGLGLAWIAIEFFKTFSHRQTHLEAHVDDFLHKIDISSLNFLIGILLAVAALNSLGVLNSISSVLFGEVQQPERIILGSIALGLLSSIIDNIPLTAIAIHVIKLHQEMLWVLLALTATTGGSLLIIGSLPGVVAMGMVKELTFEKYFKLLTPIVAIGFIVGISVWFIEYQFIK